MTALALAPAAPAFDPDAGIRARVRAAGIAAAALCALAVGTMVLVPIGGAVVASGQVGAQSRVKRVAHPTGGTIKQILVANGDRVAAGTPLLRLDDDVSGAQNALAALSVDQMLAQRARLEAERIDAAAIAFPAELRDGHPGAAEAMAEEARLFALRRSEARGLEGQLRARIVQSKRQIAGRLEQIAALRRQQVLIRPELDGMRTLWDKKLTTLSRVNQLERSAVELDGSIAALDAEIAQARGRITETAEQLLQLAATRRVEAGTQLSALNAALNEGQMRSISARDAKARAVVTAPSAGIVDKLAFAAIGDVIRPAETIMEIVPDRDRLIVEVAIDPADIEQVRRGERARIRFSGFNSTATPEIAGTVALVAPDRTTNPQTGASFFAARVEVDQAALAQHRELALKPGMPAEVFIETGSRSMLSYLTKPLRDQFARAFRDN